MCESGRPNPGSQPIRSSWKKNPLLPTENANAITRPFRAEKNKQKKSCGIWSMNWRPKLLSKTIGSRFRISCTSGWRSMWKISSPLPLYSTTSIRRKSTSFHSLEIPVCSNWKTLTFRNGSFPCKRHLPEPESRFHPKRSKTLCWISQRQWKRQSC